MTARRIRGAEVGTVLLLLVVAAVPRLVTLEADPPLRVSPAFITDEGWWAQNARQHALFGRWVMDEHNPALWVTPIYSLALRGVYALAGVGIWQTRLVSALAGILTCLVLYTGLRAVLPRRQALPPALFLALSLAAVTLNRIAFTESLQLLLMTVAASAMLWAGRRPWWGTLTGTAVVLAVLCKPNALVMAPILAGFWAGEWWRNRDTDLPPAARYGAALACVAGALLAAGIAAAAFVVPYWPEIRTQLGVSIAGVSGDSPAGVRIFFLPWLGLQPTLVTKASIVPLVGVVLLAWRRLTGRAATVSDTGERLMWWWLGSGLLFLAFQSGQTERRFLLLIVPLAVLGWRGAVEEGVRLVPGRSGGGLPRHLLAGGIAGAVMGLLLVVWWVDPLARWSAGLPLGGDQGISRGTVLQLVWHGVVALGLFGAVSMWRWAPTRGVVLRRWPLLLLWLLLEPVQLLRDLAWPTYTLRDGAAALAGISGQLPPERRAITGDLANTLALESDLFAFTIRNDPRTGAFLNLDGLERFRPGLIVTATNRGVRYLRPDVRDLSGFIPICTFRVRPPRDGQTTMEATLWRAQELPVVAQCPAGSRPGA